jgi:hypothetical protein
VSQHQRPRCRILTAACRLTMTFRSDQTRA